MHRSRSRTLLLALVALLAVPSAASAATLVGEVGPGSTIVLRTQTGVRVQTVRAGSTWTIVVRDRSTAHNFRLAGPGFARQTSLAFTGTATWTVTFRAGTWRYVCVPHADHMSGSVRAR